MLHRLNFMLCQKREHAARSIKKIKQKFGMLLGMKRIHEKFNIRGAITRERNVSNFRRVIKKFDVILGTHS